MVKARVLVILALLAALACGKKQLDPSDPGDVPASGDSAVRSRFDEARARFARDDLAGAAMEFEAIAREYPDDPVASYANLYAGMAAFRQGQYEQAVAALGPIVDDPEADEAVRTRATFFLGLASVYTGDFAETVRLLAPFEGKVQAGSEETERHAALAQAYAQLGQASRALEHYYAFYDDARPAERAYIQARVTALVAGMSEPDARRARQRVGLDASEAATDARPQVIGALLPLTGRARMVGVTALRGLSVFARAVGADIPGEGYSIETRDVGAPSIAADELVDQLAARAVIAIVGPVDRRSSEDAARRATELGVPLVTLDLAPDANLASPMVFAVALPVEQRARALARHALAQGARRFAILAPDITYGRTATSAFADEIAAGGGQIVGTQTYERKTTSFVAPVSELAKQRFDALFVADTGARLELIAPQLAVYDLIVYPAGTPPPRYKRDDRNRKVAVKPILLLSTAEGLDPGFLESAGRYAEGAIFAPGFYPDDASEHIGPYVERFREAHQRPPGYLDAYAHDAALLVAAAVNAGARTRTEVAELMSTAEVPALTGRIRFDTSHLRADDGLLFQVTRETPEPDPETGETAPSYLTIRTL